jgi:molecular chaperone HtpG
MWVGLSRFEKQIPKVNAMRGLRVRSANIQLGNDDVLTDLFKENRGNYYFVGEVFAVDRQLVPNSQRDYFNENEARVLFEDSLRVYFFDVLHKLYYEANRVKNDYKRQEEYLAIVSEYQKKEQSGFVNDEERQKLQFDIEKAKRSAEEARKRLDKLDNDDTSSPIFEVRKSIGRKYEADKLKKKAEEVTVTHKTEEKKKTFVTDSLSKLSRSERKLVSKILTIITDVAPKEIAEQIIDKIKEEMK